MVRIIVGIIGTLLGFSMLLKTQWYLRVVGRNMWAEIKLGSGGSRTLYKLIGLLIIFISWIYAFNWLGDILTFLLGGLISNR